MVPMIDLVVTTLWAELTPWSEAAAGVILEPSYWAIHGATRMGKALTDDERLDDAAIDAAAMAAGVERARAVMALLAKANRTDASWDEPPPPASMEDASIVLDGEHVERVSSEGLDQLFAIGHALQAGGVLARDADHAAVRALIVTPPRIAPKPRGPLSSLLAMGMNTLWVPMQLTSAWDSPACVVASSLQLADDLAALPTCLREPREGVAGDLAAVGQLVNALERALALAGTTRCVAMNG